MKFKWSRNGLFFVLSDKPASCKVIFPGWRLFQPLRSFRVGRTFRIVYANNKLNLLRGGFQFWISVMGVAVVSSTVWLIRNRPSGETAYWCFGVVRRGSLKAWRQPSQ